MELVSLRTIIYDILNIARGAQLVDDEPISEVLVESWVHQYRALFLKRDLDKNRIPNPDYIQNLDNISLEYDSVKELYKTSIDIPRTLDLNHSSGIFFIGDKYGNQIQLIPEKRVNFRKYNKWSMDMPLAYLSNNRVYLHNPKGLSNVYLRGVFQNPVEAAQANGQDYTYDSAYPIPVSIIPALKEEILKKELNMILRTPNDNINNSDPDLSNE